MISTSIFRRSMHHLAAKFAGGGGVHVVDPNIDFRYLFERENELKRSLEERRLKMEVDTVRKEYNDWWDRYKEWKSAEKRELREAKDGLLAALSLPNLVHAVGKEEKPMLRQTKHAEFLCSRGLMRVDRDLELIHLAGYPVLLQHEIKSRLLEIFSSAQLCSPSAFVRPAVLEGVNLNLDDFPTFSEGSSSSRDMHLVGHSLPALLSPFIKTQFTEKNDWPITVQSAGMAYHAKNASSADLSNSRQRLKHCVLTMGPHPEQLESFSATSITSLDNFLHETLDMDVKTRVVLGKELRNFESQAIVFEHMGMELARISRADDYISRRLNIVSENGFIHMVYVETDIDRVIARLFDDFIDGREAPRLLRKVMKL